MRRIEVLLLLLIPTLVLGQSNPNIGRLMDFNSMKQSSDGLHYKINEKNLLTIRELTDKEFIMDVNAEHQNIHFRRIHSIDPDLLIKTSSGKTYNIDYVKRYTASHRGKYLINLSIDEGTPKLSIHNAEGNTQLIKEAQEYILKEEDKKTLPENPLCSTPDPYSISMKSKDRRKYNEPLPPVKIYLEVDYYTYVDFNGNIKNIEEWVTDLFNETASVYAIHGITIQLSEIFIWDTPDIYGNTTNMTQTLDLFASRLNGQFNGHLAQLMTVRDLGGGLARQLNAICTDNYVVNGGPYSLITGLVHDIVSFPIYSFNVFLMAHELGHLMGSPHTHACLWGPNNDSSLDYCYIPEGICVRGPVVETGTIMSYCFRYSYIGVDFTLGFGSEPSQLLISTIMNSTCLYDDPSPNNNCIVGAPCNDGSNCTMYDAYDTQCNCQGILIDLNHNGICDLNDLCNDQEYVNTFSGDNMTMAKQTIISTGTASVASSVMFSAGNEIVLEPGFEIPFGTSFESLMVGCNNSNQ